MQPLSDFHVDLLDTKLQLVEGQIFTPPLHYRAQAMAGWALPNTDFDQPTRMSTGSVDGSSQLVKLYDKFGNLRPDFTTLPYQNGVNEGMVVFQILGPYLPGGNYTDVFLRTTDLQGIVTGTGQGCHVLLPTGPPVITHAYEIKNNGQSLGVVRVPEPEQVTIYRDGVLIWQTPGR